MGLSAKEYADWHFEKDSMSEGRNKKDEEKEASYSLKQMLSEFQKRWKYHPALNLWCYEHVPCSHENWLESKKWFRYQWYDSKLLASCLLNVFLFLFSQLWKHPLSFFPICFASIVVNTCTQSMGIICKIADSNIQFDSNAFKLPWCSLVLHLIQSKITKSVSPHEFPCFEDPPKWSDILKCYYLMNHISWLFCMLIYIHLYLGFTQSHWFIDLYTKISSSSSCTQKRSFRMIAKLSISDKLCLCFFRTGRQKREKRRYKAVKGRKHLFPDKTGWWQEEALQLSDCLCYPPISKNNSSFNILFKPDDDQAWIMFTAFDHVTFHELHNLFAPIFSSFTFSFWGLDASYLLVNTVWEIYCGSLCSGC